MTIKCTSGNQEIFTLSKQEQAKEQEFAHLAKALSHPARVRILSILHRLDKQGGCLNSNLVSELGLAQSTVSEHLRILKTSGFIEAHPQPPKVCYKINHQALTTFPALFEAIYK